MALMELATQPAAGLVEELAHILDLSHPCRR